MGLESLINNRKAVEAAAAERQKSFDRPETHRLKVPNGTSVEVVFLQELADTADTHQVEEWAVNGNGEFRSFVHTEDGCYADEIAKRLREHASTLDEAARKDFYTKYKAKKATRVYFSVAKTDELDKVFYFSQPVTSGLVGSLIEDINDEGGITGVVYRISKGAQNADSWTIKRLPKAEVPAVDDLTPYAIEDITINIPLENQPKFLEKVEPRLPSASVPVVEKAPAVASANW